VRRISVAAPGEAEGTARIATSLGIAISAVITGSCGRAVSERFAISERSVRAYVAFKYVSV
jgi:hypothetical protein